MLSLSVAEISVEDDALVAPFLCTESRVVLNKGVLEKLCRSNPCVFLIIDLNDTLQSLLTNHKALLPLAIITFGIVFLPIVLSQNG